jgi:hypothetical protein
VSGPAGLILLADAPLFKEDMPFSAIAATYAWTPSRADIGTAPAAVFKATTASGASALSTVFLGPVQDVPPGAVSGLTATHVGNRIQVQWSSNSTNPGVTFDVEGCYHTLFPGNDDTLLDVRSVDQHDDAGSGCGRFTGDKLGAARSSGKLLRVFVTAIGSPNFALLGSGSANVQ